MAKDKGFRKIFDWEAIKREYELGQFTTAELARQFGVAQRTINQRAKKEAWTRDLSKKVDLAVRGKLLGVTNLEEANEEQIIEAAANRNVEVIRRHQEELSSYATLGMRLLEELMNEPEKLYISQHQGLIVKEVLKLTASEKAAAFNQLVNAQARLIEKQREAYGIGKNETDDGRVDAIEVTFVGAPSVDSNGQSQT